MKDRNLRIINSILLIFIGLTILMIIMKLPQNAISYNTTEKKIKINISWRELGRIIKDSYKNLFKGSLGVDSKGNSVWREIKPFFKNTLILILSTIVISILLGIPIGAYNTKKARTKEGIRRTLWKTILKSFPEPLIILVLYLIILKVFNFKSIVLRNTFKISFKDYIVPIIALSIFPIMKASKITSESIIATYDSQYLISAKLKGASNVKIFKDHLIKNVFIDSMEEFSSLMALIFANLVVVEYLFYFPGLINKLIESYVNKDMNTVFSIAFVIGLIFIIINVVFRIIKNVIDPINDEDVSSGNKVII